MRKFLIGFLCAALPLMAQAANKPVELQTAIQATQPIGTARFSKFMLHVYDAAFWSDSGGWTAPPYALSITYAMDFGPEELAERTRDEMAHVSNLPPEKLAAFEAQLQKMYPAVNEGDRITAWQKTASLTLFYFNGKQIGRIDDPAFAKAFFGIWFSEKTSEPEMRNQLLHIKE